MKRPQPTLEQAQRFLELYASGIKPAEAARALNDPEKTEAELRSDGLFFTSSVFRSLANRDPEFHRAYEAAAEEHYANFEERLRGEYVGRAMGGSDRLLDNLGQAMLPELRPLRQSSVEHSVRVQIGRYFDLTQLSARACPHCGGELDELDLLQVLVEKASKPRELPPAA